MLLGVKIKNFAMLQDVAVGISLDDLKNRKVFSSGGSDMPLTVIQPLSLFIGTNNSGKSSFLQALAFLKDSVQSGVVTASQTKNRHGFFALRTIGADAPIFIQIVFYENSNNSIYQYTLQIDADEYGKPYINMESLIKAKVNGEDFLRAYKLGKYKNFTFKFSRLLDYDAQTGEIGLIYNEEADLSATSAIPAYMKQLQPLERDFPLLSLYGRLVDFHDFNPVYDYIMHWFYVSMEELANSPLHDQKQNNWRNQELAENSGAHRHLNADGKNMLNVLTYMKNKHGEYFNDLMAIFAKNLKLTANLKISLLSGDFSNAEARLFYLLLLLNDPKPRPLLLLDMPDFGLYPESLYNLIQVMREYSLDERKQILFTSHALNILDDFAPEEIWQFKLKLTESRYNEEDFWDFINPSKQQFSRQNIAVVEAVGENKVIRAMYREGVGLSSLWYSGYFE